MTIYAFTDVNDGYYQCEVEDGQPLPEWTEGLTPCDVLPPPPPPQPTKQELLDSIVVTLPSGKQFDGDETARNNMLCAITIAGFTGQTSSSWKMADNSTQTVTVDDLKQALALAMQRVGQIVGAI